MDLFVVYVYDRDVVLYIRFRDLLRASYDDVQAGSSENGQRAARLASDYADFEEAVQTLGHHAPVA